MCRCGVGNPLVLGLLLRFFISRNRHACRIYRDTRYRPEPARRCYDIPGRTRVFQLTLRRIRMTVVSRPLYRALLVAGLVATIFTGGCKKKPIANTPPPPPPVEQPKPQPSVTLSANPSSINRGGSSSLSWTSTNATQLSIAPGVGTVNAEGSTAVTPSDSTTYTITASGPGGSANATARVTVSVPPPPVQK